MPAYDISVTVPLPNQQEPHVARFTCTGPYDGHRAKAEALRLARGLPALTAADFARATVAIVASKSIDDYVTARRAKPNG